MNLFKVGDLVQLKPYILDLDIGQSFGLVAGFHEDIESQWDHEAQKFCKHPVIYYSIIWQRDGINKPRAPEFNLELVDLNGDGK